jgi:hypothetical protein
MSYTCHSCLQRFPKDSSLRGHLNQRPQCRTAHTNFLERQRQADQTHVDPYDPEQWGPMDLIDPEPSDDAPLYDPNVPTGGRVLEHGGPQFFADGSNKRTRSGTINRNSLIKAEHRPFPGAAKVIRKNEPTPWEVQVSLRYHNNI